LSVLSLNVLLLRIVEVEIASRIGAVEDIEEEFLVGVSEYLDDEIKSMKSLAISIKNYSIDDLRSLRLKLSLASIKRLDNLLN